MIILSSLLISMFTTIVFIPIFMGLAIKLKALDVPNHRKVHQVPMPKSGGLSMTLGALIPILLWVPKTEFAQSVMIGAWIVVLFGLIDDVKDLDYKVKFCGQLVAALIVVFYGGLKINSLGGILTPGLELPDIIAVLLTIFVVVGVTNAVNLSDGLDGLAGGICMLSFLCIGYLAYIHGNRAVMIFSVVMIGTIVGFLRFNTYPASVFMGDAGSQLLGFLMITLSLSLTQQSSELSPILPLIIIGLPVLDTLVVMMERIAEGGSPFSADKRHLHHKFLRLGFYHNESVLAIYGIHATLITIGFLLRDRSDWLLLSFYVLYSGGTVFLLWLADHLDWKRRKDYILLDNVVKGGLRKIKNRYVFIKVSFKANLIGIPALFIFACFIPNTIPLYLSVISIFALVGMAAVRCAKKKWDLNSIRIPLYLFIPYLVYFGEKNMGAWVDVWLLKLYNYSFVLMVFSVLMTLRFTRRKGFKVTPMDFLILFVALIIPNLPDEQIKDYQMGWVASKIIALYFSFEVLQGELRTDLGKLAIPTIGALVVITVRGLLGI